MNKNVKVKLKGGPFQFSFKGYPLQKYKLTVESYIMSHFVDFHLRLTLIANFIFEFWQPPPWLWNIPSKSIPELVAKNIF